MSKTTLDQPLLVFSGEPDPKYKENREMNLKLNTSERIKEKKTGKKKS